MGECAILERLAPLQVFPLPPVELLTRTVLLERARNGDVLTSFKAQWKLARRYGLRLPLQYDRLPHDLQVRVTRQEKRRSRKMVWS